MATDKININGNSNSYTIISTPKLCSLIFFQTHQMK